MIYLDQAATTFPKPPEVVRATAACMTELGASPGRSGHSLSVAAARAVFGAREAVADLLGAGDSRRIVFTPNATHALNLALSGTLADGDHVVTTTSEHNSVMRPLRHLRDSRGVTVSQVPADADAIAAACTPRTRLVAVNHASNVTGILSDLGAIRAAIGKLPLLVDAAQTAGALPLDVTRGGIDLLAFTGHKALLGPQGTGGLYIGPGMDPAPLIRGGTGSGSESDEQPAAWPDYYESGTPNGPGIAGLGAGVALLRRTGLPAVRSHEQQLGARLLAGLRAIQGIILYGALDDDDRLPIFSLRVRGQSPSETAHILDRRYGIMVRAGLHCAPEAHRSLGTFPEGTVRLAAGYPNTPGEIDEAIAALGEIAREAAH